MSPKSALIVLSTIIVIWNRPLKTAIYLASNDLRIGDNLALAAAADYDRLVIVYCVDTVLISTNRYGISSLGYQRFQFLKDSLLDFSDACAELGQVVYITIGNTVEQMRRLIAETQAEALITARPSGLYERNALYEISQRFAHLSMIYVDNHTLFKSADGEWLHSGLPRQYTAFRKIAENHKVDPPIETPKKLPEPLALDLNFVSIANIDIFRTLEKSVLQHAKKPEATIATPFKGGETFARKHIENYFNSAAPSSYKETRNALTGWETSSKWSCWLTHGCLSARQLWHAISLYEAKQDPNESTHWLRVELLWREYFQWLARQIGKQLFSFKGLSKKAPLTSFYAERYKRWCAGNTPYPLVNACMLELKATGYMSNRGRQIVASCLVNEYQIDWRYGAAWFEHHLIDYDVASNWGNWQYIAGVGVDPRGGRHFDIGKQSKQYDPEEQYVRYWLGDAFVENTPAMGDSVDAADWPIG